MDPLSTAPSAAVGTDAISTHIAPCPHDAPQVFSPSTPHPAAPSWRPRGCLLPELSSRMPQLWFQGGQLTSRQWLRTAVTSSLLNQESFTTPNTPTQGLAGFGLGLLPRLTWWDLPAPSPPQEQPPPWERTGTSWGACRGAPLFHNPWALGFLCREMHPSVQDMGKLRHRENFAPRPNSNPSWIRASRQTDIDPAGGGPRVLPRPSPPQWLLGTADGARGQLSCPSGARTRAPLCRHQVQPLRPTAPP